MNLPTWLQYFLITILVSTPFYLKMRTEGGSANESFMRGVRSVSLVPGLVALAFRLIQGKGFADISLGVGRMPWLILAVILFPLLMELLLIFTSLRFNLVQSNQGPIKFRDGLAHPSESIQLLMGHQPQPIAKLILNLTITIFIGTLFTLVFSLLEEFGWRGFLQNELISALGVTWGIFIGGLAWGGWFIPLVLMGYKFPDFPRLGAYIYMPIAATSMAILIGYAYWLSGSLWVAAFFNAAIQVSGNISTAVLGDAAQSQRIRIVWLWLWAVAAGFCLALWSSSVF